MGGGCSTHGRNAYKSFTEEPKRKRPVGRPRRRGEDSIRMNLKKVGWGGVDWMHLAQDRDQWRAVVNTVINLRVP
jgi:hypothetical protein